MESTIAPGEEAERHRGMQRRKGATALVWQGAHGQRGFSARTLQDRRHIEARNGGGQHPGVSRGRLTGGAQELDASRAQLKGRGIMVSGL